jgi:8-oxo-dGTP pyrophosphatase MutT (NUDIX family)
MTSRVKPWTVRGSRYLIRERWLTARIDDCVTPAGVEVPYYVQEYPGWVNVVALDKEDHLIVVRLYRHALGGLSLELPGGCMEEGESPVEAGARELLEETGYGDPARLTLVASLSPNTSTHANRVHTVLAEGVSLIGVPEDDGVEVLDVERVPYREALDLAMSGAIMQTAHIASLVLALNAGKKIKL